MKVLSGRDKVCVPGSLLRSTDVPPSPHAAASTQSLDRGEHWSHWEKPRLLKPRGVTGQQGPALERSLSRPQGHPCKRARLCGGGEGSCARLQVSTTANRSSVSTAKYLTRPAWGLIQGQLHTAHREGEKPSICAKARAPLTRSHIIRHCWVPLEHQTW